MIGMRFQISADFHADIELVTGIDTKVWDLNGPHLEKISMQGQQDDMVVTAQTHEEGISIAVAEGVLASYPAEMKQIVKIIRSCTGFSLSPCRERLIPRINGLQYSREKML